MDIVHYMGMKFYYMDRISYGSWNFISTLYIARRDCNNYIGFETNLELFYRKLQSRVEQLRSTNM